MTSNSKNDQKATGWNKHVNVALYVTGVSLTVAAVTLAVLKVAQSLTSAE